MDVTVPLDHFPEEGRITLSFDAFFSGYRDPLKVTLSVEKVLPLPRVIDLGAFIGSTTKDIELREVGRRAGLKIAGVTCSDPCLRVAMRTPTTFRITVDSVPVGEPIEAFADVTFDGGSIARQRVSIQGMASGGLLVHPNPLVFGHVRISNGPLTKEVRIDSDDGKPFSLSAGSFDQDQELFSIRVTAESDTRTVCHITVHPRRPGALDEVVKLMTTDGQRGVSIRCVGMIE